ncbi:MAG TPA: helix-turn-helix domain-containing protein [Sedimentisphaerales bacterium]|nr:helix-turn-helix domain-containing protein [Sedimentisphaerales bacterium]
MAKGKNILTTGEVARICKVAPRTVSKWFDSGRLKGYRIPGSKDRRIPVNELIRFMKMHSMPLTTLPVDKLRVLIVDSEASSASVLADALRSRTNYEVETVNNNFDTGLVVQRFIPHALLINLLAEDIEAMDICKSIRQTQDLQTIKIIALAKTLSQSEAAALQQKGFDGYISDPSSIDEVVRKIEEATAIIY